MPSTLCEHCTGYCCRYIALPIETPEDKSDFDDVRWYLLHEGVTVFVEDGEWFICVSTTCRHLQPDYRCGIYETRPQICRDYSTDNCDYHSGDYGWEQHFTCPEHLDEYAARQLQNGGAKRADRKNAAASKRRRPRLKARAGGARQRFDYSAATVDTRGVALPVLGTAR